MRCVVRSYLVFLISPLASVLGQTPSLEPGQRIRVTAPSYDLRRTPATFYSLRSDTLRVELTQTRSDAGSVAEDPRQLSVPLVMVSKLEVIDGRRSNWDKGALIGALIGGGIGTVTAVIGVAACDGLGCPETGGEKIGATVLWAAASGLAGGLVGAVVGATSSRDTWREVPLGRARVGVLPTANGVGLRASIRF